MQPAKTELPTLGDDFAALCETDLQSCVRRVLTVTSQRAEIYFGLAERHADLVEYIESINKDRDVAE